QRYDRTESYRQAWEEYYYKNTRFRGRVIATLDGRDDLPYWEFGVPDDNWTADGGISDLVLGAAPIIPPGDPKIPLGTLAGTVMQPGASLHAPTTPPYNTKIDTTLYDTAQIVMTAPAGS